MRYNLYIYYRLTGIDSPSLATLGAMQAELASLSGIQGQLLRKRDDATTWMEIYEGIDDDLAFTACLSQALAKHDIPAHGRHEEWFVRSN